MSVIIRLQNLPWSANALDIRHFFQGLSIPDGGVHIVGGELGDAFIAFSTDEDARQAFNLNGGKLKEIQVKLLLSSRTEMQKIIEAARNQTMAAFIGSPSTTTPSVPVMPAIVPSIVPEIKKDDIRDRRRSRSRSKERKDRNYDRKRDKRRERSRSKSRERSNRDRRRRDRSRSRSRDRDRKNRRVGDKTVSSSSAIVSKEPRVNVWENPPILNQNILGAAQADPTSLIANFVANNILPNILNRNNTEQAQIDRRGPLWDQNNVAAPYQPSSKLNMNGNQYNYPEDEIKYNPSNRDNFDRPDNLDIRDRRENLDRREMVDRRDNFDRREDDIPNCCVKLYPFYGAFSEIRRFFNRIFIHNSGIKFINDENGKRTGIVYIKFAYPAGKEEALSRAGDVIRNHVISVEHIEDITFNTAVDRFLPELKINDNKPKRMSTTFTCLMIENVAMYIKEPDIRNMFPNFPSILVAFEVQNRSKNVYVKFPSPNEANDALQSTDRLLGGQTVNIEPCDVAIFEKIAMEKSSEKITPSTSILLTNLPLKCSDRDIIDFFSDVGVMPCKIELMADESGFIGESICDFYNMDDAVVGFQKNGMLFGTNNVVMKYKPKPIIDNPPMINPRIPFNAPNMNMNRPFFPRNHFMGGPRGMPPRGLPPMMGMMPRGMPPRLFPPPHGQQCDDQDESLAAPGCILLMENVPYQAGLQEILDFFDGFNIPSDNVLRKYNYKGMPSGETKVIFNSPEEVYHIIQEKRGARIRNRPIHLSQV